jgi:hypothetical protein
MFRIAHVPANRNQLLTASCDQFAQRRAETEVAITLREAARRPATGHCQWPTVNGGRASPVHWNFDQMEREARAGIHRSLGVLT